MTIHDLLLPASAALGEPSRSALANRVSALGARVADWLATAANYYAAAAVYEQLSRLSDSELRRRELSRATLASDICQAFDRADR
jgi:hypothetical protein